MADQEIGIDSVISRERGQERNAEEEKEIKTTHSENLPPLIPSANKRKGTKQGPTANRVGEKTINYTPAPESSLFVINNSIVQTPLCPKYLAARREYRRKERKVNLSTLPVRFVNRRRIIWLR